MTQLVLTALISLTAAQPLVLEDPRGDDNGPGSYIPPTGSEYRRGDFDLRRFSVRVEKDVAVVEVVLGANVRRYHVAQRTNAGPIELSNGIYVQNVDIYVDTTPGKGFTTGLPGRRVAFAKDEAWDVAIALTPQPGPTRTILTGWNKDAAEKVITPVPVRANGPTLSVRIPLWQLGGAPKPTWGWSVMVSGAAWEHSFSAVDRLRGGFEPNAFTLPVYGVAEERAFGGATVNGAHPYVIDVLLPKDVKQSEVLGQFAPGSPARVPMVYQERPVQAAPVAVVPEAAEPAAEGRPPSDPEPAPQPSRPPLILMPSAPTPVEAQKVFAVANIQGDTAVIPTPSGGVKAWQIGTVFDAQHNQVGRLVVTSVSDGFVLATLTDGKGRVAVGHEVRFAAPPTRTGPDAGN